MAIKYEEIFFKPVNENFYMKYGHKQFTFLVTFLKRTKTLIT